MDLKDLNKSQLILLTILLSFIVSIATSVTAISFMQQTPKSVTIPINKVVRETVEKIIPVEVSNQKDDEEGLSSEQKKLLEELKAIKPLTVSLYSKKDTEEKILGTGLFLGNNKVVIASLISLPAENEIYIVKSILGEQKVSRVVQEKDFSIIELVTVEEKSPLPETLPN
jgi:cell shape-determining protein MreC